MLFFMSNTLVFDDRYSDRPFRSETPGLFAIVRAIIYLPLTPVCGTLLLH